MSFRRTNLAPIGVRDSDYNKIRQNDASSSLSSSSSTTTQKKEIHSSSSSSSINVNSLYKTNSNKDIIVRLYNFLLNQCVAIDHTTTTIKDHGDANKPEILYDFRLECLVYHPPVIYTNTLVILICLYIIPYIIRTISNHTSNTISNTINPSHYITTLGFELKSGLGINILYIFLVGIIIKKAINHYGNPKNQTIKGTTKSKSIGWIVWIVRVVLTLGFIVIPTLSNNFNTILDLSVLLIGLSLDLAVIDNKKDAVVSQNNKK